MIRTVPVKFRLAGKHYLFNALDFTLNEGDRVVVETDRGRALGIVVAPPAETPRSAAPEGIKNILKMATDEDIALAVTNAAREEEAFHFCHRRIVERNMEMKLVKAEYLFDGSKIIFYFTADGRIDFRELVKDLAHHFHTRIEMRQIGVRDEAKLTGGIGICGRELCCCTFLVDFTPVSVKMAKEQGLALNPTKISGQCGRLLCCLAYEFETYCSLRKALPKCGRKISFGNEEVEVVEQNVLGQTVTVVTEGGQKMTLTPHQIETGHALPPPESHAEAPPKPKERPQQTSRPAPQNQPKKEQAAPAAEGGEKPAETKSKNRRRRRPRRK